MLELILYRVEPQILDYQTQQMKLFPAIATSYCYMFLSQSLWQIYYQIEAEILKGDVSRLAEVCTLPSL